MSKKNNDLKFDTFEPNIGQKRSNTENNKNEVKKNKSKLNLDKLKIENKLLIEKLKKTNQLVIQYKASHEKMLKIAKFQENLNQMKKNLEIEKNRAIGDLVLDILKPIDWLEQIVIHSPKTGENPWIKGLRFSLNQFMEILESHNVKKININVGDKFDSHIAEVVDIKKVVNEKDSGRISSITRDGYIHNNNVIRHASVVVTKGNK